MEKLERILTELVNGLAYTITFIESDSREKCFDLWFEKEDTAYCLQEIYIENGISEEKLGGIIGTIKPNRQEVDGICEMRAVCN